MAYSSVTLTGKIVAPNGAPRLGHITIHPNVERVSDAAGKVVLTGPIAVQLDAQGAFSVQLPATDDVRLSPSGFQYRAHGLGVDFTFSLPAAPTTVDIAALVPVSPAPVSEANLQDATVSALLDNASTGVRSRLDAAYVPHSALSSWPIYLYGNSYSILAAGWFTSGKHYAQLASTALGGGSVTSYGVSGRRIIDVIGTLLNGTVFPGCSGVIAAGKWPGVSARSGLVILESFINDMGHYPNMTGAAIPAAVTTAYRNAMKVAYRAALALISSQTRVEAASATVTGTWTRGSTQLCASGGLVDFATANGAAATYSLTPPQSGPLAGKVYLSGFTVDPSMGTMAAQEIRVDGVLQTSRTPAPWEQYVGNAGGQVWLGPDVIEVTLPIDGAAHNVELKHVGSAAHLIYNDCALIPSADPNPVAVMGAEHAIVGTPTWTAAQAGVYTANNRTMAADLKAVAAEFPHAVYVPSTMTTGGIYSADGIHPNDRGMAQRANDLVTALESTLRARLQSRTEALRPDSEFGVI